MKSKPALLAAALALTLFGVHAQTQAPGLWEHSFKLTSQGGEMERAQAQMQAQLAAMPPEQRKKIEEMMKGRGVTLGGAQGTSVKFCLSKEQAAKPPEPQMAGDCRQTDVKRSGNTMSYQFACTTPQRVSGEGQVTYLGEKAYTGKSTMTTQLQGQPQQMGMDMAGRWLAADCGDVKPLGALPAK
ncbi:MAG: DUF3617 domain-containing protein [Rhizobiales bacterium]|nr:DUF3617 domain-containing protein [Rhizobacter sp.]